MTEMSNIMAQTSQFHKPNFDISSVVLWIFSYMGHCTHLCVRHINLPVFIGILQLKILRSSFIMALFLQIAHFLSFVLDYMWTYGSKWIVHSYIHIELLLLLLLFVQIMHNILMCKAMVNKLPCWVNRSCRFRSISLILSITL